MPFHSLKYLSVYSAYVQYCTQIGAGIDSDIHTSTIFKVVAFSTFCQYIFRYIRFVKGTRFLRTKSFSFNSFGRKMTMHYRSSCIKFQLEALLKLMFANIVAILKTVCYTNFF